MTTGPLMTGVGDIGNGSARRRRVEPERRTVALFIADRKDFYFG